ncbi:MAG: Crp/Fnr family transcriptional regulator [Myxococcales bacterium]|nr:Crp/Fnr family transcriptional regulator [Myxococcales bacterium]
MPIGENTEVYLRQTYQRTLAPGETVFDEGDPGDQLYIIQSGEIELIREIPTKQRVVARLGPGDFFGELGLVCGERRSARAVAVNESRVIALDRETLEAMCLDQPEIAIRMIRVLVSRLIEAERRLSALGVDDLMRPVVRALLRYAQPDADDGMRAVLNLKQLAEAAGLSMREAHRAVIQLVDQKLVQVVEDGLVLLDRDALDACFDAPE